MRNTYRYIAIDYFDGCYLSGHKWQINSETRDRFYPQFSLQSEALNCEDSNVWAVSDRAHELADKGEDVIFLCVGDPNFDTPEPILDFARARLGVGRTHYSPRPVSRCCAEPLRISRVRYHPTPVIPMMLWYFPAVPMLSTRYFPAC